MSDSGQDWRVPDVIIKEEKVVAVESVDEDIKNSSEILRDIMEDQRTIEKCDTGFVCDSCGKVYKTATTLKSHVSLKHPSAGDIVQCTLCNKQYSSEKSLEKHVDYKHRHSYHCPVCYRSFAKSEILDAHRRECVKEEMACSYCSKVYPSKVALKNHIKYKHIDSEHNCDLCRRSFRSARGLANHYATIHRPEGSYCAKCCKNFTSVPALQSHILYRHSKGVPRCNFCNKMFPTATRLNRHLVKNHCPKFLCGLCGNGFENLEKLIEHVAQEHGDDSNAKKE